MCGCYLYWSVDRHCLTHCHSGDSSSSSSSEASGALPWPLQSGLWHTHTHTHLHHLPHHYDKHLQLHTLTAALKSINFSQFSTNHCLLITPHLDSKLRHTYCHSHPAVAVKFFSVGAFCWSVSGCECCFETPRGWCPFTDTHMQKNKTRTQTENTPPPLLIHKHTHSFVWTKIPGSVRWPGTDFYTQQPAEWERWPCVCVCVCVLYCVNALLCV